MKIINVSGYFGLYAVTDDGRIFSLKTGEEISTSIVNGYKQVVLSKNGIKQTTHIHKVVYYSFNSHKQLTRTDNLVIDHIDGNKLNNNLANLRKITTRENTSRSKFNKYGRGVHYIRKNNNFSADIQIDRVKYHLGVFDTADKAAQAYQTALYNYENDKRLPYKQDRTIKTCKKCGLTKPVSDFYYVKNHGYSYMCKECHKAYHRMKRQSK